jgi:phosphoglycerate dehydrogenase-like enzyme
LPDGAVFVNVGRGRVVSEEALVAEAASGRLRVAVDVCEAEPHYVDSPIMNTPQILLSPHIAGPTVDLFPHIGQRAVLNLQRYLRGESPEGLIDLNDYDRST